MQETGVQSLGGEDPLEKETATHSSVLIWEIPWAEESARQPTVHGVEESWTWLSNLYNNNRNWIYVVRMQMLKSDTSPRKTDQESVDGALLFHHCPNQGFMKGHWWKMIKDPISAS